MSERTDETGTNNRLRNSLENNFPSPLVFLGKRTSVGGTNKNASVIARQLLSTRHSPQKRPHPMHRFTLCVLSLAALGLLAATASAHHPNPPRYPTGRRFEPIPPLGNRLPPSYRRAHNRPTYIGGKIAYIIAPSSQEAMSWHENAHRGAYRNHSGRIEPMYLYPKAWEVLSMGPRTPTRSTDDESNPAR